MKQGPLFARLILMVSAFLFGSSSTFGWSEHPLMAYPVLSTIPGLPEKEAVRVESLKTFLMANEQAIERVLADYELWATSHLPYYPALPSQLRFRATGNPDDVVERFLHAIRLNPQARMGLYLHLLPHQEVGDRVLADPRKLTTLNDVKSMLITNYVELIEGQMVLPLDVIITANDEPDYGFDLGHFENNNTAHGAIYGFGIQPFGDPNLEYGSQAPFHMGFYHEAGIVFALAPFLKKTLPEYRISLFQTLSGFALSSGNHYWGWRFMGWGMHYLGDLSMPYHAVALPGVSPLRMLWINLKAMLGFPRSRDNAVQLVSNRHSVLEEFQRQVLRTAYVDNGMDSPLIRALKDPIPLVEYHPMFPREVVARESADRAKHLDRLLMEWMPREMVSNPRVEVPGSADLDRIVELAQAERGAEAVPKINGFLAEAFRSYSMHLRSFYSNTVAKVLVAKGE